MIGSLSSSVHYFTQTYSLGELVTPAVSKKGLKSGTAADAVVIARG